MNKKEKESVIVRGIAAAIQSMAMPTFQSLREILSRFGWTIQRLSNKQTNQQLDEDQL